MKKNFNRNRIKLSQNQKEKLNQTKLISQFLKNAYSYFRSQNNYRLKTLLIAQPATSSNKLLKFRKFIILQNSWCFSLKDLPQIQEVNALKIIQKSFMINIYTWRNCATELFLFYKTLIPIIIKINNNKFNNNNKLKKNQQLNTNFIQQQSMKDQSTKDIIMHIVNRKMSGSNIMIMLSKFLNQKKFLIIKMLIFYFINLQNFKI